MIKMILKVVTGVILFPWLGVPGLVVFIVDALITMRTKVGYGVKLTTVVVAMIGSKLVFKSLLTLLVSVLTKTDWLTLLIPLLIASIIIEVIVQIIIVLLKKIAKVIEEKQTAAIFKSIREKRSLK